jgi:Tfp pilus assembly protein FimT
MVALAIMMIMTGIAVVAIGPSLRDARLRSGCRMVASACNYARSRAVSTNTSARVFFDQGRTVEVDTVALVDSTDPNSGTQAVPLTTAAGRYRYLPDGISVVQIVKASGVSPDNWLDFGSLGQADQAIIQLSDEKGTFKYVIVDPITGRCRVQANVDQTTGAVQPAQ